jgi:hypothetical protein
MSKLVLNTRIEQVAEEAKTELYRATTFHGSFSSAHEGYAVILEELDELWDLVKLNPAKMTVEERRVHLKKVREEAIQISAMGMRFAMDVCGDRA